MRAAISASSSRGVKSTRRLTKLKRTPRTPASCRSPQLAVGDAAADGGHAARPAAARAARVGHRAVVRAVAGGLHDDVAREAEVVAQREQLRLARVAGGVLPLGRVRELRARAEHVAVRVHRAGRRREPRLARARAPVEPAGGLLEGRHRSAPPSRSSRWSRIRSASMRQSGAAGEAGLPRCLPNSPASARSAIQAWRSAVPAALHGSRPASRTVTAASRISSRAAAAMLDDALEEVGGLLLPVDAREGLAQRGDHRLLDAVAAGGGEALDHHRLQALDRSRCGTSWWRWRRRAGRSPPWRRSRGRCSTGSERRRVRARPAAAAP